jgi:5,10-methylenetetrahydromethanopterin reductase
MTQPLFGFSISPGDPTPTALEAADAEAMGYHRIGVWDSPALFREPWVVLASMAQATRSVRLGTWVTNPQTRHPVVTASAAATLDDLAPGRTYIGIGSGDTGVSHLGVKAAPLARLEAYVLALRQLLESGEADYNSEAVKLRWANAGKPRRIPIIVAAHGPKALRLAGRIGDGVIAGLGVTPEVIAGSLELIEQGARESGRRIEDIEVWFTCFWFVDPTPGVAKQAGAWAATSLASHFAKAGTAGKFVPPEYEEPLMRLGALYDKLTHGAVPGDQKAQYAEAASELGVLDYFQRRFSFAGTPDEVHAQIEAARAAGASRFDGAIDADLPEHRERITAWAQHVLNRFR